MYIIIHDFIGAQRFFFVLLLGNRFVTEIIESIFYRFFIIISY